MNETCSCGRPRERGQFCTHCYPALARVMINRRDPRVVAQACIDCDLSLVSCHAEVEYQGQRCCSTCSH